MSAGRISLKHAVTPEKGEIAITRSWHGRLSAAVLVRVTNEATTEMANNPKKIQDPTEAALSAIQEALEVRDHKPATDESPAPVSTEPEIAPEVRRPLPRSSVP